MVLLANLDTIVEVAFVTLVVWTCYSTLTQRPAIDEAATDRWKGELKSLEDTLRELIGEASAASSNLNRNLLKRREELNGLLARLDRTKTEVESIIESRETELRSKPVMFKAVASTEPDFAARRSVGPSELSEPVDEPTQMAATLEGASHVAAVPPTSGQQYTNTSAYQLLRQAAALRPPTTESIHDRSHNHQVYVAQTNEEQEIVELEELAELSVDRATISPAAVTTVGGANLSGNQISNRPFTQASVTPRTQARAAAISNLAARVEKLKSRPQPKQPLYLNSNVDPAAITVARRLLRMGKEIHVVARKVDLPVSDVREIDRALRAELNMSPVEEFAGARHDEEEISAATPAKVVIERSSNFV